MEISGKVGNLLVGLLLIGLCTGFPIGLENSAADYHTQFLTGLVGVLLTVCGIVFLVGCLCCQRKNGFKEFHNSPVVASSTSSLDHGHINPIANGEFTIFTPLSPPHHNNNVFLANEQIVGQTVIDYNHADIDVHSWFDGTERDFPRTKLKYIKELGKGWFGRVVEGTAQGVDGNDDETWMPVAVRILEASATSSERAVFLHDATIYRCGKHPHILKLLGRSLESVPLLLLQELCPRGDLKRYLKENRGTAEKLLSSDLPLLWCCQLSSAVKHLHDHRLAHPDLAARNCQIISDLSLKLGDYGLAASHYPEDYYQGAPAVPVRWCAPESLTYTSTTIQPKQITFEGNVWSMGVTMWEIYACGAQPYAHLNDDDVISQVLGSANVRLAKPELSILYIDYIFRLMQLCWSTSESRPSVSQVHLMLTDLMQVYQNTKHITHSEPLSIQDFDKRWDNFKPNSVSRTDNQEFIQDSKSLADLDLSDITVLNMNLNKDEDLLNTKPMSPSLNNLHGSLDNLTAGEMDSWLQKVANKTGDMSYVRGLSEAIKDLDNALALENVSSSDSSHQPSPAPENIPKVKSKLEFKLGPTMKTLNDSFTKTQMNSLTESMQRTSSESETEDENWRRKIERGAYSEKVHQKSKSVTDLMVLTHIDCSESDSETPLPSLDYRVNYRNVRYAPKQNLENASLMFGSEGNLLSIHDKFQEELKRLQEERKDSLLFVPESNSRKDDKVDDPLRCTESSSSDEEAPLSRKNKDPCTYVNTNTSEGNSNVGSASTSPSHRKPESLIEELSSPADIKPGSQVYNIFNVTVDANFSPMHIRPDLKDIICFEEPELKPKVFGSSDVVEKDISESREQTFQVPKLTEIIQNNDYLMDYIIAKYESQENLTANLEQTQECEREVSKELNNNIKKVETQDLPKSLQTDHETPEDAPKSSESQNLPKSSKGVQEATQEFLLKEQENYMLAKIEPKFDISQTQEEVSPNSMTHSAIFSSTPFVKRNLESFGQDKPVLDFQLESEDEAEILQFSSNFADVEDEENKSELKYSLETWDNFLGKALEGPRECNGFDDFSCEPQSLLFVDGKDILDTESVECKNEALIESFNSRNKNDLKPELNANLENVQSVNKEHPVLNSEEPDVVDETFTVDNANKTFTRTEVDVNDVTIVIADNNELNKTYDKEPEGASSSNWEPGEGWFLHPQTNSEVSGQMEVPQGTSDTESYVGFSMDDEIMAAIRNELLMKLPQAQGQASEQVRDSDEWDTEGRSEVLIKYNVYTTPLSPIPEESYSENDSHHFIYNRQDNSDSENEDWPEPYEEEHNSGLADIDTETHSHHHIESPVQELPPHRHTPSQDSCCSNDTLFNLEELNAFIESENEKKTNEENETQQELKSDVCDTTVIKDVEIQINGDENINKTYSRIDAEMIMEEIGDKNLSRHKAAAEEIPKTADKCLENKDAKLASNKIEESDVKTVDSLLKISVNKEESVKEKNSEEETESIDECRVTELNEVIGDKITPEPTNIKDGKHTNIKLSKQEAAIEEISKTANKCLQNNDAKLASNKIEESDVKAVDSLLKISVNNEIESVKEKNSEEEIENIDECGVKELNEVIDDKITPEPTNVKDVKHTNEVIVDAESETKATDLNIQNGECHEVNMENLINADDIQQFLNQECIFSEENKITSQNTNTTDNKGLVDELNVESVENLEDIPALSTKEEICNEEGADTKDEINTGSLTDLENVKVFVTETERLNEESKNSLQDTKIADGNNLRNEDMERLTALKNIQQFINEERLFSDEGAPKILGTSKTLVHNEEIVDESEMNKRECSGELSLEKLVDLEDVNQEEIKVDSNDENNLLENSVHTSEDVVDESDIKIHFVDNKIETASNKIEEILKDEIEEKTEKEITDKTASKEELHNVLNGKDAVINIDDQFKVLSSAENKNDIMFEVGSTIEGINQIKTDTKETECMMINQNVDQENLNNHRISSSKAKNNTNYSKEVLPDVAEEVLILANSEMMNEVTHTPLSEKANVAEDITKHPEVPEEKTEMLPERNELESVIDALAKHHEEIKMKSKDDAMKLLDSVENHKNYYIINIKNTKNEVNLSTNDKFEVPIVKNEVTATKCNETEEDPQDMAAVINENGRDSKGLQPESATKPNDVKIDFIKNEKKVEDELINHDITTVESKGGVNLTDIDKLIIKNIQNGLVLTDKPQKWIDDINHIAANENKDADSNLTEGFSLLVENNPNYVTEFLNHERQSSISSLGSSRDDDLCSSRDDDLCSSKDDDFNQTNKNFLVTDCDYVNIDDITIKLEDAPSKPLDTVGYVNTDELQDLKNDASQPDYVNLREDVEEHLYDPVASDGADADIYDALTDIRFTGPSDVQLMSTSFSESADIDEQDWDSGSDTRSSSSGEFIWKEGEHEESVKALRAAPQDVSTLEKVTPMEDIEEVSSESSDEDEEGDSPEFVPSAWDKYATPTKSALRSPEKTLEKSEVKFKKPKGVWFKKQKYHCVYEYPREPESPSVNSYELWQPVSTSLIDWEVDTSPYIPTLDGTDGHLDLNKHPHNLYQLADFSTGMSTLDDEFFISSTARPFETFGGLSSQFFPGQSISDQWMDLTKQANENATPDSGVEDITPASTSDSNEFLPQPPRAQVQSLKTLAGAVVSLNESKNNKGSMGGLRHARNKLKLDLPPSPSAFTSTKAFTIEPPEEPVMKREVPTFSTFGKSRFLVQHVDTPTCDEESEKKNVSFEALPYKPMQITMKSDKAKVEVRGEASLLDSADEDSGIESSTLERKKITNIVD